MIASHENPKSAHLPSSWIKSLCIQKILRESRKYGVGPVDQRSARPKVHEALHKNDKLFSFLPSFFSIISLVFVPSLFPFFLSYFFLSLLSSSFFFIFLPYFLSFLRSFFLNFLCIIFLSSCLSSFLCFLWWWRCQCGNRCRGRNARWGMFPFKEITFGLPDLRSTGLNQRYCSGDICRLLILNRMQVVKYTLWLIWLHLIFFLLLSDPNEPMKNKDYPDWPRYILPEQEYKVLSLSMENKRALRMRTCSFWLNYAPTLYTNGKCIIY